MLFWQWKEQCMNICCVFNGILKVNDLMLRTYFEKLIHLFLNNLFQNFNFAVYSISLFQNRRKFGNYLPLWDETFVFYLALEERWLRKKTKAV